MILNPIYAMLHNTSTDRWHPIIFAERPFPGPQNQEMAVRHKSSGHHTVGYDTREEALKWIEDNRVKTPGSRLCVEKAFAWDGKDVPAMTVLFAEQNDELVPAIVL